MRCASFLFHFFFFFSASIVAIVRAVYSFRFSLRGDIMLITIIFLCAEMPRKNTIMFVYISRLVSVFHFSCCFSEYMYVYTDRFNHFMMNLCDRYDYVLKRRTTIYNFHFE